MNLRAFLSPHTHPGATYNSLFKPYSKNKRQGNARQR